MNNLKGNEMQTLQDIKDYMIHESKLDWVKTEEDDISTTYRIFEKEDTTVEDIAEFFVTKSGLAWEKIDEDNCSITYRIFVSEQALALAVERGI